MHILQIWHSYTGTNLEYIATLTSCTIPQMVPKGERTVISLAPNRSLQGQLKLDIYRSRSRQIYDGGQLHHLKDKKTLSVIVSVLTVKQKTGEKTQRVCIQILQIFTFHTYIKKIPPVSLPITENYPHHQLPHLLQKLMEKIRDDDEGKKTFPQQSSRCVTHRRW